MRLGLGARLAIAFALLAALTALVTSGVSAVSTNRQVNSEVDRFLQARSFEIADGSRIDQPTLSPEQRADRPGRNRPRRPDPIDEGDLDQVDNGAVIDDVLDIVEADAEVQILNADGNVLVTAGVALPVTDVDRSLLKKDDSPKLRTIEIDGEPYRVITRHIGGGGAVQVAQSLRSTNALLGDLRSELLVVGVGMSALSGLVGWAIASRTTKPLRRLTKSIEQIAATEDLSTPIALDRSDEIGRLSDEFDVLLKTLDASRSQQHRLVQDAAHELRTPLTSVRANIDFLERARDLDAETRSATLGSIKSELSELSSILAEVVELATESRDASGFERVDLATVAEAALAQFELRSARPVVRDLVPSEVSGDASMLARAAGNLIGNADKYSPTGLSITVSVRNGSLWVSDQGPGIDQADRDRVFDRFYRSDEARSAPGSGLGLAIVSKAAAEHGGTVWVSDAAGGGAEVGFTLPTLAS